VNDTCERRLAVRRGLERCRVEALHRLLFVQYRVAELLGVHLRAEQQRCELRHGDLFGLELIGTGLHHIPGLGRQREELVDRVRDTDARNQADVGIDSAHEAQAAGPAKNASSSDEIGHDRHGN
jgi:hypothetical protein